MQYAHALGTEENGETRWMHSFRFYFPTLWGRVIWGHWPRETGSTDSVRAT